MSRYADGFVIEYVEIPKCSGKKESACYFKTLGGYCSRKDCSNCGHCCKGWTGCCNYTTKTAYESRLIGANRRDKKTV